MALLPFPKIPHSTRHAHVFPALKHKALLSISQLWDHGLKSIFNDTTVQLDNANTTITGTCDLSNGLYFIDLRRPADPVPQPLHLHASNTHEMTTKADLVQYLHRASFSLVVSTWTQAIDSGFFATWPGLTSDLVRKKPPKSLATAKGHLRQDRKNVRSIKKVTSPNPPTRTPSIQTHIIFMKAIEVTGKIATDQTGQFPVT